MHTKTGFKLRDICGEKVVMAIGIENVDFTHIIALNESAAYLWQIVNDKEFNARMLAELLCKEYEIDKQTALDDAESIIMKWTACGIIE